MYKLRKISTYLWLCFPCEWRKHTKVEDITQIYKILRVKNNNLYKYNTNNVNAKNNWTTNHDKFVTNDVLKCHSHIIIRMTYLVDDVPTYSTHCYPADKCNTLSTDL